MSREVNYAFLLVKTPVNTPVKLVRNHAITNKVSYFQIPITF
jgi:hypothetical protein